MTSHDTVDGSAAQSTAVESDSTDDVIIRFDHVSKTYPGSMHEALRDINLKIRKGDIYGIIGLSGAGKSTLVRCINGIERVDEGQVTVAGNNIAQLGRRDLRDLRRGIGMVFQSFNLMPSRTVEQNIALAWPRHTLNREQRHARVVELLKLVELDDKIDAYPADLSGGQRQRVAIARALANDPQILLSDEATSALDPLTTESILALLGRLNRELGITIVVITHQMQVVKEICNRVAVISNGRIVEGGDVYPVFADPQSAVTRSFVDNTSNLGKAPGLLGTYGSRLGVTESQTVLRLKYVAQSVAEPLVAQLGRDYNVLPNILFADVSVVDGAPLGGVVIAFDAAAATVRAIVDSLKSRGISVETLQTPQGGIGRPDDAASRRPIAQEA